MMRAELTPWETEQLIDMSRLYCGYRRAGADENTASPYTDSEIAELSSAGSGFDAIFNSL